MNDSLFSPIANSPVFVSCSNHSQYSQVDKFFIMAIMGSVSLAAVILNTLIYIGFALRHRLRDLPCGRMIWHVMVPSDILTSLCIPVIVAWDTCQYYLPVPKAFCVAFLYVAFLGSNVSKWSIALIAFERFLAICWPLKHRKWFTTCVERGFIIGVWLIIGLLVFLEVVVWPLAIGFIDGMPRATCQSPVFTNLLASTLHQVFGWYILFVMTVVCYTGLAVAVILSVRKIHKLCDPTVANGRKAQVFKTFRVTSLIIVSFGVCWMPYQIIEMLNVLKVPLDFGKFHLRSALLFLTYVNSLVNPVTYFFMDKKFRDVVFELVCCGRRQKKQTVNQSSQNQLSIIALS